MDTLQEQLEKIVPEKIELIGEKVKASGQEEALSSIICNLLHICVDQENKHPQTEYLYNNQEFLSLVKEFIALGENDQQQGSTCKSLLAKIVMSGYSNRAKMAQVLMDQGSCIKHLDKRLYQNIIFCDRLDLLEVLLADCTQSYVNSFDDDQSDDTPSPLHWAVLYRKFDIICFLVSKGFDINDKCMDQTSDVLDHYRVFSPLHYAAETRDWELATLLLEHGASVFALSNHKYETPFTSAMDKGHIDLAMKKLLPEDISDEDSTHVKMIYTPNHTIELRGTILHYACCTDSLKSVKKLVELGADVKKVVDGYLPIQLAIIMGQYHIVDYLFPMSDLQHEHWTKEQLDYAFDNYINNDNDINAIQNVGDKEVGRYILDAGSPEVTIDHFITVCVQGRADKVKLLLEYEMIPSTYDYHHGFCHPLWTAVEDSEYGPPNFECVKAVLESNPDMFLAGRKVPAGAATHHSSNGEVKLESKDGTTVMQEALLSSNPAIITLLVEAGCCLLNTRQHLDFVRDKIASKLQPHILKMLEKYSEMPQSLQHLAKFGVRRCLGKKDVETEIDSLELPVHMKQYLKDVGLHT